ncbi:hypothetical protein ABZY36_17665 [Streptomyces sp. NPDC006627]|uniref:hypothetical protein n=1 Tax=Streptomyces sp. NPDC006627 TaxID=3154679 RepID=UPI0033A4B0E9
MTFGGRMADELSPADIRTADALAYVCANIDDIRDTLRDSGPEHMALLDELLTAACDNGDLGPLLDALHAVVQAGGDARGVYVWVSEVSTRGLPCIGPATVPGFGPPSETAFLCPLRRCTRFWLPRAGEPEPCCEINGVPLRKDRL